MIREKIQAEQRAALKAGDKPRTATLRLILAKIKDRDIELRTASAPVDDDAMVTALLQKMAKQYHESIALFEKGGRADRAEAETAELAIINEFLPAVMSETDAQAAIASIISEVGATAPKDMGRVMSLLKERHGATMDMRAASAMVKNALAG